MEPGLYRAGRRSARSPRREGHRRPDQRFRRRHPGRDHRQSARRAARRARRIARLVAGDPGCARTRALPRRRFERGNQGGAEFLVFLESLVERRRAQPGDPERDVLTRLIQGRTMGEPLSRTGTTAQLHLPAQRRTRDDHEPDRQRAGRIDTMAGAERARLIEHPELIKTAVEEFLRFESSNQLGNRIVARDTIDSAASSCPQARRSRCASALRTAIPRNFPTRNRLDIGRSPNRHLAFGSGPHQCAGMELARLEGRDRDFTFPGAVSGVHAERSRRCEAAAHASADS